MKVLSIISVILAVTGFYAATLRLLRSYIKTSFDQNIYFFLFLSFVAWSLSSGLRAIILVWGYSTNAPLFPVYCFNGIAGAALLGIGWPVVKEYGKIIWPFDPAKFDGKEKAVLASILFVWILYLYRVTIPWSDQDETESYGYLSKLIAAGRTFADIIAENTTIGFVRSQLVQCWDAQLYGLVNGTYLVRFDRLINLFFCGVGIYSFLRLMRVGRWWTLCGVAAFFSTPELAYLALSLKVDAVVMMFELAALLNLIMAVVLFWQDQKSRQVLEAAFILSLSALLLSAFAFGSRFTGIIPMVLCFVFSLYFLIKLTQRPFVSLGISFILFVFFMFISSPGYWMDLLIFNNPIYPTKCFWPFQHGAYIYTEDHWKSWSIEGFPPGILQVYLVFALGIGVELLAKVLPLLSFLPMAAQKSTSTMGWSYPLVLSIFLWPFFWRFNRTLNLIVGVFIFQLIGWSLGFHYSRLFIASSTLMILGAVMMADLKVVPKDIVRARVQKILRVWIMISLGISLLLQVWWFSKRFYGPFLISPRTRYQAAAGFLKDKKDNREQNLLTYDESLMLNHFFLAKQARMVIYTFSFSDVLQVLFDSHIHVERFNINDPFSGGGRYLLLNPAALGQWGVDKKTLLRDFPNKVLTTPRTKWEVYSIAGIGEN